MKYLLILTTVFLFSAVGFSQDEKPESPCGTHDLDTKWLNYYLANKAQFHTENDQLIAGMRISLLGTDNETSYYNPNSLLDAMCQLNKDFEQANIHFVWSEPVNYIPNSDWNFHETFPLGADLIQSNPIPGSANVFIGSEAAGNCGYYWMDAVVLAKSCTNIPNHTFAHEMGHYFSLPHTFRGWEGVDYEATTPTEDYIGEVNGGGIENVDDPNCHFRADRFCDTPVDYLSFRWSCNGDSMSNVIQTDLQDSTFRSDGRFFMSYSNDNCVDRFSAEQIDAMRANLQFQRWELIKDTEIVEVDESNIQMVYPTEDDLAPNNNLILSWNAVPGATQYILQIYRHPYTQLTYYHEFVQDTFATVSGLPADKTLAYRIRPFNEGWFCTNWSEGTKFKTFLLSETNEIEAFENVSIYPTLIERGQSFNIDFDSEETLQNSQLVLKDLAGKTLQTVDIEVFNGKNQFQLNPESSASGIYFLGIETEKGRMYRKVIVK